MSTPTQEEIGKASQDLYAAIVNVARTEVRLEVARKSRDDDAVFPAATAFRNSQAEMATALESLLDMHRRLLRAAEDQSVPRI